MVKRKSKDSERIRLQMMADGELWVGEEDAKYDIVEIVEDCVNLQDPLDTIDNIKSDALFLLAEKLLYCMRIAKAKAELLAKVYER